MVMVNHEQIGYAPLCDSLGVPRATLYRHLRPHSEVKKRLSPPRRIPDEQRTEIRSVLNSKRFWDMAPAAVYTTLLDEGTYLCSERSMYRILTEAKQIRIRRQRMPRNFVKPELLAIKPNEVWSWDITRLKGPVKWTYYYMYKIMDIFSRYIVGWMIADREKDALAEALIDETCLKQEIVPGTLTLHSDRGGSMTAKLVAHLLADLGITRSLGRPHVSNDNPYSESAFKTLKYRPEIPQRFYSLAEAEAIFAPLFRWYNQEHRHSGIAMLTPYQAHYGEDKMVLKHRTMILSQAYDKHPERFVKGCPQVKRMPQQVWINKPILIDNSEKEVSLIK